MSIPSTFTVFDKTYDQGPLGLNVHPHRLIFVSTTGGTSYAIACAVVNANSSMNAAEVKIGDILISVNKLSVLTSGNSYIVDLGLSLRYFETIKTVIAGASFPKTLTFLRLSNETPTPGRNGETSTQLSFQDAYALLDGNMPISGTI